jgi:hypothetical protein
MMTPDRDDTLRTDDATEQPSTADLAAVRTDGDDTRVDATTTDASTASMSGSQDDARRPLFAEQELDGYRSRWQTVQVRFVDDPRDTVKEADALVAELMQRLSQTFAEERSNLEGQWERGTDVSTEDLRVAMQRYRSFFDRLLAA